LDFDGDNIFMRNTYICKKGLVTGYSIGLQNDNLYFPIPNRNVLNFKKYIGEIETMLVDGTKRMIIKNWSNRIIEEQFKDKDGRGIYKIGYFLYKPKTKEETDREEYLKYLL